MRASVWVLACAAVVCGAAFGQEQPAGAVNNQDEQINIPAAADPGSVLTIFRSGDKQAVSRYVSEVIELQSAVGLELLPTIQAAVEPERGSARAVKYAPEGAAKPRYFIHVVTTEAQMPSIRETIKALDLEGLKSSSGTDSYSIRMSYRKASEVAQVLEEVGISGLGTVYADDKTNTLFVEDSVSDSKGNLGLVDFFDVPPPQVEFEVQVIEIRSENFGKLGLDWEAWKRGPGGQFNVTKNWFESGRNYSRIDGLLTMDATVVADFLNYAAQEGTAEVKQSAKISGDNLTPALLRTARRIPYYGYALSSGSTSVVTEENPEVDAADKQDRGDRVVLIEPPVSARKTLLEEFEEGLAISITPTIGTEMVTAEVEVAANTVSSYDEMDRPVVLEQDLSTVLTLQDNKTMLAGRLERKSTVSYRRGIPGLKSIPVLKYLFSVKGERTESSELVVLVTPCFCNRAIYDKRTDAGEGKILRIQDDDLARTYRDLMLRSGPSRQVPPAPADEPKE